MRKRRPYGSDGPRGTRFYLFLRSDRDAPKYKCYSHRIYAFGKITKTWRVGVSRVENAPSKAFEFDAAGITVYGPTFWQTREEVVRRLIPQCSSSHIGPSKSRRRVHPPGAGKWLANQSQSTELS